MSNPTPSYVNSIQCYLPGQELDNAGFRHRRIATTSVTKIWTLAFRISTRAVANMHRDQITFRQNAHNAHVCVRACVCTHVRVFRAISDEPNKWPFVQEKWPCLAEQTRCRHQHGVKAQNQLNQSTGWAKHCLIGADDVMTWLRWRRTDSIG